MAVDELIPPHGGKLVQRLLSGAERDAVLHQARSLPSITLDEWELSDLELLADGALSPLEGFLREADYDAVVDRMQLADGTVWPLPITLSLTAGEADLWREGTDFALKTAEGQLAGVLHQPELYPYNPLVEAKLVYGTTEAGHPGVARLLSQGPYYVGGRVSVLDLPPHAEFSAYRLTPAQVRQEFSRRGWRQVVGFQTHGPVHRAHEYLLRCALEITDGLLIHPPVGPGHPGDLPASLRLECHEVLLKNYFPKEQVMLVVNPAWIRDAGPREAVFQAILRQNYGCSHFIIGRNQAGLGKFYGPWDARKTFQQFQTRLAATPLYFDNAFFCKSCQGMGTVKTCSHPSSERISLSTAALQESVRQGRTPPPEFTRPEVAEILNRSGQQVPA